MDKRRLGRTDFYVTPIGFGAFKIGRNEGIKYPQGYTLPDKVAVRRLLNDLLDMGVNYIDTAPAYGLSEQHIGDSIAHRRNEFVLSTKVGETFTDGQSVYDFSEAGVRLSVERSLKLLRTDVLDVVFIHSNGDDLHIIHDTDVVATLQTFKQRGLVRAIGFSGKTVEGAAAALAFADALMVQYHHDDQSHENLIADAHAANVGVVVKKGLESGHLDAKQAVMFVLKNPCVTSMVVGSLNAAHMKENVTVAAGGFAS